MKVGVAVAVGAGVSVGAGVPGVTSAAAGALSGAHGLCGRVLGENRGWDDQRRQHQRCDERILQEQSGEDS